MGLGLRRVVLQYPWRGGRFRPESVAAFNRNQWQPSTGIGGRFRPESVATFDRNTHAGLRRLRVRTARTLRTRPAVLRAETHLDKGMVRGADALRPTHRCCALRTVHLLLLPVD